MSNRINLKVHESSTFEGRRTHSTLVEDAELARTATVLRHGEPVAVVLGYTEFERSVSHRRNFSAAYEEAPKSLDLENLNSDPDKVYCDSRDETGHVMCRSSP